MRAACVVRGVTAPGSYYSRLQQSYLCEMRKGVCRYACAQLVLTQLFTSLLGMLSQVDRAKKTLKGIFLQYVL